MNATISGSRVVPADAIPPIPMRGPVEIPQLRIEDDLISGVRLELGPVGNPSIVMPCASREVAERTQRFFGGGA